jgi:hypothetical protein
MDGAAQTRWASAGSSVFRGVRGAGASLVGVVAVWSPMRLIVVVGLSSACWLLLAATGTSAGASPVDETADPAVGEGAQGPSSAASPTDGSSPPADDAGRITEDTPAPATGSPSKVPDPAVDPADSTSGRPHVGSPAEAGPGDTRPETGDPAAQPPPGSSPEPEQSSGCPESAPTPVPGPDTDPVDDRASVPSPPGDEPAELPVTPSAQSPTAAAPSAPAAETSVPSATSAPALSRSLDETTSDTSLTWAAPRGRPQGPSVLQSASGVPSPGVVAATDPLVAPELPLEGPVPIPAPSSASSGTSSSAAGAGAGAGAGPTVGCPAALTGQFGLDPPVLQSWHRGAQNAVGLIGATNDPGARPG